MRKLLIASNNAHKLAELKQIFAGLPFDITSPAEEGLGLDPAETGVTFEENAIIKARAFARVTPLPVLADDSGLEVDALGREPGVYSARYGNTAKNDHEGRYRLVLEKLAQAEIAWPARSARFRCVMALATADQGLIGTGEGTVEGFIAYEPAGQHGFGYDPIFFVPQFNQTLAQLSAGQKHAISHRGRAARALIPLLKQLLSF